MILLIMARIILALVRVNAEITRNRKVQDDVDELIKYVHQEENRGKD